MHRATSSTLRSASLAFALLLAAAGCSGPIFDAQSDNDAGTQDAGDPDAGPDGGGFDAGPDGGGFDGGAQDAGNQDAGTQDAGNQDAGVHDAGNQDAGTQDAGIRDWSGFPAIVTLPQASSLWVLSDIHGDDQALITLLSGAGIIDQAQRWAAGTATFVIVGDMIDKGPDAVGVIRLVAALQSQARSAGGQLVVTMGNHEAEFLADPTNSKASASNGFDVDLADAGLTPAATAAGLDDVGLFIRDLPFAARVGDWFFAHAGNTAGQTLAQLSAALVAGVNASGFGADILANTSSILEAKAATSVFWEQSGDPQTTLTNWAHALGAERIVVGHEPAKVTFADGTKRAADTMFQRYNRIFLIDTGMSVGANNTGGALLHVPNPADPTSAERVTPDGAHHTLVAQ